MPLDRHTVLTFTFPSKDDSGLFGASQGKFWTLVREVVELAEVIVTENIDTESENLDVESVGNLRDRLIQAIDRKMALDYPSIKLPHPIDSPQQSDQKITSVSATLPLVDSNSITVNPTGNDVFNSASLPYVEDENPDDKPKEEFNFENSVLETAQNLPWNEAMSQIAALMLNRAARRTKTKTFPFADALKALIYVSRAAGFKFLNPNAGEISHLFFQNLLERNLVKETEWMFKFPSKPFSSIAANHPDELSKISFNKPGSTRDFTAYGLTTIGFETYRKDLIKLGLLRSEIEFVEEAVRHHLTAPWDEIPELTVDPDSVNTL